MTDTMIIPTKPFFVAENEALKKKINQLEKEADWLAERLTYNKCPPSQMPSMCVVGTTVTNNSDCIKCWREEAKNEVHKQL